MPQRQSAKKELKKNVKRRARNLTVKTRLKKVIKSFKRTAQAKEANSTQEALKTLYKTLDKAAAQGIIHKNKAARKKSRLSKLIKKPSQETTS